MARFTKSNTRRTARGLAASLCALSVGLGIATQAGATDIDSLQADRSAAKTQVGDLQQQISDEQEQIFAAQSKADAAAEKELKLNGLLDQGEAHADDLASSLANKRDDLKAEKDRLLRARRDLAGRLVAIYKTGVADPAELLVSSDGFNDLVARSGYMKMIEDADSNLATRVEQVRNSIKSRIGVIANLEKRAIAYNNHLTFARDNIAAVQDEASAEASQLASLKTAHSGSLEQIQADIASLTAQIAKEKKISEAAAAEEVDNYLGGPYAIPTYIVMCESGGNYSAVNPSSGAGGAYQILPSTWELYGGEGLPEDASPAEQDAIAAQIYADSGPAPWVCG